MSIIIVMLIFCFVVFVHELGHYIFARRGGIAVEEFAIGMGPKLFGFERKGTLWTIRLLPIGGYCRMYGEDVQAPDQKSEAELEKRKKLNGGAFYEKSVGVRMSTIFGGPLFNFIMALVFSFIYIALTPVDTTTISVTPEEYPAYEAGIRAGDRLISIDGRRVLRSQEAQVYINVPKGKPVDVKVRRNVEGQSQILEYEVKPVGLPVDSTVPPEESDKVYIIGIGYVQVDKTPWTVIQYGVLETASWIKMTLYSLGLLITGEMPLNSLGGPIAIVDGFSETYDRSLVEGLKSVLSNIAWFIVLLSANLGVFNLMPIPALDGGRLSFLLVEAVRGNPVAPNKEGVVHFIGFVLLMILMVIVFYNDLLRLFV